MNQSILPKSALAVCKHSDRTDKYRFISTLEVIKEAEKYGWNVVRTGEANLRKKSIERGIDGFQKHIIIMEHPNFRDGKKSIQFCIRNSHNGTSGLQLFIGCMVVACANQLFSKDMLGKGNAISIRHSENGFQAMKTFISQFDLLVNKFANGIRRFEEKVLSPEQVKVFAQKAIELRYDSEQFNQSTVEESVRCLHFEQKEDNLWNVLNRVQESLVRGNLHIVSKKGKLRRTRKIKSMEVLVDLNTKLLNLANDLVEA
jgi:hypothetical protein